MPKDQPDNSLSAALRYFEATEANLIKLERLWEEIEKLIPPDIVFGANLEYEEKSRIFRTILPHLPKIDDWQPIAEPWDLNAIAQARLDAREVGEIAAIVSTDEEIDKAGSELREYKFLLNQKRKELVRESLIHLIDLIDEDIRNIHKGIELRESDSSKPEVLGGAEWIKLKGHVAEVDTLLGSADRPRGWYDLHRHLHFGELHDFRDIELNDWPSVKKVISQEMYGANEPIPVSIGDLSELVRRKPSGPVTRELAWNSLTPEQFERLIFSMINAEEGYENPQWLTKTNAPDHGRDLSVERVVRDPLAGVIRQRVIIQCKHWLGRSISIGDVEVLKAQMKLWEPPRVDVHIIVTSGRFTSDALELIEKHNHADQALRIEMWPDSHLEMLLASRPALIAEFGLRQ